MGQAFDSSGNVIAEAFGKTKKEVFDKLSEQAPDATEIRIRTLVQQVEELKTAVQQKETEPMSNQNMCEAPSKYPEGSRNRVISLERRRELVHLAEQASDWIVANNIAPHELCFFRESVGLFTDIRG